MGGTCREERGEENDAKDEIKEKRKDGDREEVRGGSGRGGI